MKVSDGRLRVVAAGAAIAAVALSASVLTTSAGAQTPTFAHSCSQQVTKGHFTCFALKRTDVKGSKVLAPDATPSCYGPSDIQSAYKLPAASGPVQASSQA